jgi:hypothetical protein
MKSLITKSLIPSGVIVAVLALTGSGAVAAGTDIHHRPVAVHAVHRHVVHRHVARRVAVRYRHQPFFAGYNNLGEYIEGFFNGFVPQQYAPRSSARYVASPSYDSSPAIDTSSAGTDAQAASDQEAQQMQSLNDENALNASVAAAEQQNEAANAAALQTEINAGN